MTVVLASSRHPAWLSNSFLVGAGPGLPAAVIDAGGPVAPLLQAADRLKAQITHVLLTHHHHDHVVEAAVIRQATGAEVVVHEAERPLVPAATASLAGDALLEVGGLPIRALHVPGHTLGQVAYLAGEDDVFTGDTLFAGSVGGTRGPGHGTFEQLKSSIMVRLMAFPHATVVHPGHQDDTTIGAEWEGNPFVRAWRGLDDVLDEPCEALGEPASLLVWARDYDGGTKAWVRFADGREDVVGGSRVRRRA